MFGWSELVDARSPVDPRANAHVASSSGALLYSLSGSVVRCSQLLRPYVFAYLFRYYIVIAAASIASKPGPVLSLDAMDKLCCKANFKTMIRLSSNSLDFCHRRGGFAVPLGSRYDPFLTPLCTVASVSRTSTPAKLAFRLPLPIVRLPRVTSLAVVVGRMGKRDFLLKSCRSPPIRSIPPLRMAQHVPLLEVGLLPSRGRMPLLLL